MKHRSALIGLSLALSGVGLVAAPSTAAAASPDSVVVQRAHACTKTSSGSCIKGGQFCPQASYHHSGWDAQGRRYVCKGSKSHPHWMKP